MKGNIVLILLFPLDADGCKKDASLSPRMEWVSYLYRYATLTMQAGLIMMKGKTVLIPLTSLDAGGCKKDAFLWQELLFLDKRGLV